MEDGRSIIEDDEERVAVQLAQDERTDAVSRCHGGAEPLACARSSTGVRCDRAGHRPYEGCVGFVACSRVRLRARGWWGRGYDGCGEVGQERREAKNRGDTYGPRWALLCL